MFGQFALMVKWRDLVFLRDNTKVNMIINNLSMPLRFWCLVMHEITVYWYKKGNTELTIDILSLNKVVAERTVFRIPARNRFLFANYQGKKGAQQLMLERESLVE